MKKCEYCAKEISYFDQYCSIECHEKANNYYEMYEKYAKIFSVINMICVFGIPIGLFLFPFIKLQGTIIASASCVVLGLLLIFLPFPTENMISKFKLQKAMKITRFIGCGIIGFGLVVVAFMFFFFA